MIAMTGFGKTSDRIHDSTDGNASRPSSMRISMLNVANATAISITRPVGVRRITSISARLMLTIASAVFSHRQNRAKVPRSPNAAPAIPAHSSARNTTYTARIGIFAFSRCATIRMKTMKHATDRYAKIVSPRVDHSRAAGDRAIAR